MKTSLIIISALLVLSVLVPVFLFIYNGMKNTNSTKNQVSKLLKSHDIVCKTKTIWRKNFIGISTDNKMLIYINLNTENPVLETLALDDLKQCIIHKENGNGAKKVMSLKKLSLEFVYKSAHKPNSRITFFNIDEDLIEDFELQRIEKWKGLIESHINQSSMAMKMAS
ncbi:hypothetical protein ACFFU9_01885 [Mariniflexile ostreae]|uniref:Uncharacterized protein n=1 Tax=Mariniflexile ostreae TaxID=1520892 RepID=A0ABV5F7P4_9FLAO